MRKIFQIDMFFAHGIDMPLKRFIMHRFWIAGA